MEVDLFGYYTTLKIILKTVLMPRGYFVVVEAAVHTCDRLSAPEYCYMHAAMTCNMFCNIETKVFSVNFITTARGRNSWYITFIIHLIRFNFHVNVSKF